MATEYVLPPQSYTPIGLLRIPSKDEILAEFKGKPVSTVRTPALFLDRAVVKGNCQRMGESAKKWGVKFRAHVKTHKTVEGTRLQLESSPDKAIVVSTLVEAWAVVNAGLVIKGLIDDILYGLPLAPTKVADLAKLQDTVESHNPNAKVRVMIDNMTQLHGLEDFGGHRVWSVFIKVDHGGKRAGLTVGSQGLRHLIQKLLASPYISIYGFYCHAGDSYSSKSLHQASSFLTTEMEAVNAAAGVALELIKEQAAALGQSVVGEAQENPQTAGATHATASLPGLPPGMVDSQISRHQQPFILSVGATPTAHASALQNPAEALASEITSGKLELHTGNYSICDLQQCATGLIGAQDVAHRVLASVISYYPGRGEGGSDEAMCDAGGIAMSRDTGPWQGYGYVVGWEQQSIDDMQGWKLGRCSQEHGILVRRKPRTDTTISNGDGLGGDAETGDGGDRLVPGQQVWIIGQHACLTSAAHPWYYIVDSSTEGGLDAVQDIWVPWKGW